MYASHSSTSPEKLSGLQVAKVELFKVPPRWLFLKLTTADGHVGWGEPVVEGHADTVIAAIKEMEGLLNQVLVDRSSRRFALTPAGEDVAERASAILASAEDL
ncbi:MAG: hypothetical protein AAGF89_04610, partial [Bacteroidota bacterium]